MDTLEAIEETMGEEAEGLCVDLGRDTEEIMQGANRIQPLLDPFFEHAIPILSQPFKFQLMAPFELNPYAPEATQ